MESGESSYTQLFGIFENKKDDNKQWILVKEELLQKENMKIYLYASGHDSVDQRKVHNHGRRKF